VDFSFTPDPDAPLVLLTDEAEQPGGEIHVRRLPDPSKLGIAYADVVYRRTPLRYTAPLRGRIDWKLHSSPFDPIADLEPEVLSAHFMTSDVYGGGFAVEDRRLLKRLYP
jgi:acetoacetate decarboxylase